MPAKFSIPSIRCFGLPEDNFEVVVAGPEARIYHLVLHEIPPDGGVPWDITRESPGYSFEGDRSVRDVNPQDYAGLFLSGGRAPEYLRYDQDLIRVTQHFFDATKAGCERLSRVEIAVAANRVKGKRMTTVAKCALDCAQGEPSMSIKRSAWMGTGISSNLA